MNSVDLQQLSRAGSCRADVPPSVAQIWSAAGGAAGQGASRPAVP